MCVGVGGVDYSTSAGFLTLPLKQLVLATAGRDVLSSVLLVGLKS